MTRGGGGGGGEFESVARTNTLLERTTHVGPYWLVTKAIRA